MSSGWAGDEGAMGTPGSHRARLVVGSTCTERILAKEIMRAFSRREKPVQATIEGEATCFVDVGRGWSDRRGRGGYSPHME